MILQWNVSSNHSRDIATLTNMYNEDIKYGGIPTESFIYKFGIFLDLTSKAGLVIA